MKCYVNLTMTVKFIIRQFIIRHKLSIKKMPSTGKYGNLSAAGQIV